MKEKWFGVVGWCDDDIACLLNNKGIDDSEDNIAAVRVACENNHHFTDTMIEAGWETLEYMVDEVFDEDGNLR